MSGQKHDPLLALGLAIMELGGEYEQRVNEVYKRWAQEDLETAEWKAQEIKRIENEVKSRQEVARDKCKAEVIKLANEITGREGGGQS